METKWSLISELFGFEPLGIKRYLKRGYIMMHYTRHLEWRAFRVRFSLVSEVSLLLMFTGAYKTTEVKYLKMDVGCLLFF